MNKKEKRNTPKFKLWLSLGVVVLLFIGTQLVMESPAETEALPPQKEKKEQTEIPKVLSNVRVAESEEEVYEFFRKNTPGLARAEEHGAVKELNQSAKMEGREGNFYLDRIWYDSMSGYIFTGYDLSLFEGVDSLDEGYGLVQGMHLKPVNKEDVPALSNPHMNFNNFSFLENDAIIFNGRIYQKGNIAPFRDKEYKPLEKIDALFTAGFALSMPDTGEMKRVEFPLQIKHDQSKELVERVPINQQLSVGEGIIHIKHLDMMVGHYSLIVEVTGIDDSLRSLTRGKVIADNGEGSYFHYHKSVEGELNTHKMVVLPFTSDPKQLTMQFDSLQFASDDSYKFRIDVQKHLKGKEMEEIFSVPLNQKVKEAFGTEVIVKRVEYGKEHIFVDVEYITPDTSPTQLTSDVMYGYVHHSADDFSGNLLSMKDSAGNDLNSTGIRGGESSFRIEFNRYLNRNKQYLDITVDDLIYEHTDIEEFIVDLPK